MDRSVKRFKKDNSAWPNAQGNRHEELHWAWTNTSNTVNLFHIYCFVFNIFVTVLLECTHWACLEVFLDVVYKSVLIVCFNHANSTMSYAGKLYCLHIFWYAIQMYKYIKTRTNNYFSISETWKRNIYIIKCKYTMQNGFNCLFFYLKYLYNDTLSLSWYG